MRVEALRQKLDEAQLDGYVCVQPQNRRYLSGFSGSAGALIVARKAKVLITDGRYALQAPAQAKGWEVVIHDSLGIREAMRGIVQDLGLRRLGFEADFVSVAQHALDERALPGIEWVDAGDLVPALRMVKEQKEIERMQRAASICDAVFEQMLGFLRPGLTELDVAQEMNYSMGKRGASGPSFDTIVAFGERSALPHAQPSGRVLKAGDAVLMDFGAIVDGYCSDMTRTVFMGSVDKLQRHVYNIVIRAQDAALQAIRPGVAAKDVDAAARRCIEQAGYGEAFVHSLGHGVGLNIHEMPNVSASSPYVLREGMAVTAEPGVYLEGLFGVRVEDLCVVGTPCRNLCAADKTLIIL